MSVNNAGANKRRKMMPAEELREEILFKQPESSHRGDCPICLLPHPIDVTKTMFQSCCSKTICRGCFIADPSMNCPFCRHHIPSDDEEGDRLCDLLIMKRIEANDPAAMYQLASELHDKGEYSKAFEYLSMAAKLGDVDAHYLLSVMYERAQGVEKDDEEKRLYHLKVAAIAGHHFARYNLGCIEMQKGEEKRAIKHWIIGAKLGFDKSLEWVEDAHEDGLIGDETYAEVLRAYQAAVDATKSQQRDEAEARKNSS